MTDLAKKAQQEAARLERKFGLRAGATGAEKFQLNVVPTGSLALDYALGTGGWPLGHPVEVFGAPDIGKSSVIGLGAIRNAQAKGMLCGIIALEPSFDPEWAKKNGVDPEGLVIARPEHGEEAFDMLHEWVTDDIIDFIVFDSIGAVVSKGELDQDEFKVKAFGQAGLITAGVQRILIPTWKNNKGVIFLNQQRDAKSRIPNLKDSPGGNALRHSCAMRVQIKTVGSPFKAKIDGEDVIIGKTLVGVILRNKLSEGSSRRAEFDYYQLETDDAPVGIDWAKDVIATAIRTRIIEKAGGWYRHPNFPDENHQLQGRDAVAEFLSENPKALDKIRDQVLQVMLEKQSSLKNTKPDLEVVDGETR